jgi:hypothetical protein
MNESGFAFPGEVGSPPEIMTVHDCMHALSGYGAEPENEVRVAGFSVGAMNVDPAAHLLFLLFQFHLGIAIAPDNVPPLKGLFRIEDFLEGVQRGAQVNIDFNDGWMPYPVMHRQISELREEYGIPPK